MSNSNNTNNNNTTTDFYKLLEISKNATDSEIKKAYKKAAFKHHPDRKGDSEMFKKIQRANEILSDPQKRHIYDQYGEEGLQEGPGGQGMGENIWDFINKMNPGFPGHQQPQKSRDMAVGIQVSLQQLFSGDTISKTIPKQIICDLCQGKGGHQSERCSDCQGRGMVMERRQIGPAMIQQMQRPCIRCSGQGIYIPPQSRCMKCQGKRILETTKTYHIQITPGMQENEKIIMSGESNQVPGLETGDLIWVIQEEEHNFYHRRGDDLFIKKGITLLQALTGFCFPIDHLNGKKIWISSSWGDIISDGDIKIIRSKGMPINRFPGQFGNLLIQLDVEFPKSGSFSEKQIDQLKDIMGNKVGNDDSIVNPNPNPNLTSKKSKKNKKKKKQYKNKTQTSESDIKTSIETETNNQDNHIYSDPPKNINPDEIQYLADWNDDDYKETYLDSEDEDGSHMQQCAQQ